MKSVRGYKIAIRVSDLIGPYLPTFTGVSQGDLVSPLLFDIVADGLSVPPLVDGGPKSFHYADDDDILLLKDNLENAENFKITLCTF